jgi:hypothetical protein
MMWRNKWEIMVFGLKRSGHHGVCVWLGHHFPPKSVHFINDVRPFHDPFIWHQNTRDTTGRLGCFLDRRDSDIVHQRQFPKECLMYNYEEFELHNLPGRDLVPDRLNVIGKSEHFIKVLVLRDPFNLVASRLRPLRSSLTRSYHQTLDRWVSYAREFLGETNYLGPKLKVNFNKWFSEIRYRQGLARSAGLVFTDAGLNRIPNNGYGSSFDGIRLDHCAQQMKVLERWKGYVDHPDFCALFEGRKDVDELSERIFGKIPETHSLFYPSLRSGVRLRTALRTPGWK